MSREVAPPGWEDTVLKMKDHPEIDNPFALAWWMSGQGGSPGGSKEIEDAVKRFRAKNGNGGGVLKDKRESMAASSMGQLFRGEAKEGRVRFVESLREATVNIENRTVDVVLIQEGLGNFGDMHYYPADTLRAAVDLFEGCKIYADHPSKFDEENQPERTTRDVLGYHTNIREADNNGRMVLLSTVKVLSGAATDWAWQQLTEAIEYAKKYKGKDLIGVSINAGGVITEVDIDEFLQSYPFPSNPDVRAKVEEAKALGKSTVCVVSEMRDAMPEVSADMVTVAGAGGKVIAIRESNTGRFKSMKDWLKRLIEKAKGGSVSLSTKDLKAALKEAEDEAPAAGGDGEPDGDETPSPVAVHVGSGEAEDGEMMAAFGRHTARQGKKAMPFKDFKEMYNSMQAEDGEGGGEAERGRQSERQGEDGETESERRTKAAEAKRVIALESQVKTLTIDKLLAEARFAPSVEKKLRPILEKAAVTEMPKIINDWNEIIRESKIVSGPSKGGVSLRETADDNSDLFESCKG